MSTSLKNLLLISITLLLVSMGGVAKAQTTYYDFSTTINGGAYFITLIGDNGNLTGPLGNATYIGVDPMNSNQPYGSITQTITYGEYWGTYNGSGSNAELTSINIKSYNSLPTELVISGYGVLPSKVNTYIAGAGWSLNSYTFTVSGGVAPEMDASLIPQVGLLLGCLFFLMGRKKEVVEPMMTA